MAPPPPSPISASFQTHKSRILASLSTPASSYTDASPKGSLDTAIVPLIERLNGLDGVVTTSSCAGRVSVFLEGRKEIKGGKARRADERCEDQGSENQGGEIGGDDEGEREDYDKHRGSTHGKNSVPGGKGLGGRWLFVSHDPLVMSSRGDDEGPLTKLFGLTRHVTTDGASHRLTDNMNARYARFAFEPMILHIATASLSHATPILSAAISAGFRESGVQSLKNLTDPNAVPMVAVRSAGLAFESVIGAVHNGPVLPPHCPRNGNSEQQQEDPIIEALVDEEYLEVLVGIANGRSNANTERIRRFEDSLFGGTGTEEPNGWEDKQTRQERKKAEGLRRREEMKANHDSRGPSHGDSEDRDIEIANIEAFA
ncbi:MAG: hypothetical protein Q9213_000473 [Squamulea squamosa]